MGFATLNHHLAKWGYVLNDGKDFTPTIDAMGFRAIPRAEFESLLAEHAHAGGNASGRWAVEADLATVAGLRSARRYLLRRSRCRRRRAPRGQRRSRRT